MGVGGLRVRLTLTVNGEVREADGVWEGASLLYALREHLDLPGSKNACEQGECGSCTVYLDGVPVCACLVAAGQANGREIVTVEGLATEDGELRFEAKGLTFHQRLREGFLAIARQEPARCALIDADRSIEAVEAAVWATVAARLGLDG